MMTDLASNRTARIRIPRRFVAYALVAGVMCVSCARLESSEPVTAAGSKPHKAQKGVASIYRDHRTASGERFRAGALCAAHRHLPFGSLVKVTHLRTGRSVVVRINDRGPFTRGRIIDLTPAAASAIGLTRKSGIANVEVSVLRHGGG